MHELNVLNPLICLSNIINARTTSSIKIKSLFGNKLPNLNSFFSKSCFIILRISEYCGLFGPYT